MKSRPNLSAILAFLGIALGVAGPGRHAVAQTQSAFEAEIRAFERADLQSPPPPHPLLFVGSSTLRGWTDLAAAFPAYAVLNRGFGGSQLSDVLELFDRVILPYHAPLILIYEGDNDLASGKSVDRVFQDWIQLAARIEAQLPDATLAFISVKPSPSRLAYLERQAELNDRIRQHLAGHPRRLFIDVFHPMLDDAGQPRRDLFVGDLLHLNAAGYALWTSILGPVIDAWAAESPFPARRPETGEVLVDFGADTRLSGDAAPTSATHWNNLLPSVASSATGRLASLLTLAGLPSPVGLSMLSRFNGANENGTVASPLFPASATRDSLFGNTETFGGLANVTPAFALTGLDPTSAYSLTFYASRLGVSDNRETRYTVTGASTATADLNAANNVNGTATLSDLHPDAQGRLTVALSPGPNNNNANHFTYLGVLRLEAASTGGPVILIDAGASGSPTTAEAAPRTPRWNDVPASLASRDGAALPQPLIATNGTPTRLRLEILSRFHGANENGTPDSPLFPASATLDSLFGHTETFNGLTGIAPRLRLTGLDPSARCHLTFFASRTGVTDNRETRYVVTGAATASADLDAANNLAGIAALEEVRPDPHGALTIALVPGPGNNSSHHFTYLGVLRLRWELPAPAPRPRWEVSRPSTEGLRLQLSGRIARTYRIQRSADLREWIDVDRVTLDSPTATLVVPPEAGPAFYRAAE